jgi:hypothetical protein
MNFATATRPLKVPNRTFSSKEAQESRKIYLISSRRTQLAEDMRDGLQFSTSAGMLRTKRFSFFFAGRAIYELKTPKNSSVRWSSWLWHLLNTQNVPSSILGRITFFPSYNETLSHTGKLLMFLLNLFTVVF